MSPPPPYTLPLAILFTTYSLLISLSIFLRPLPTIRLFGLAPPPSVKEREILPFIYVFGGRNLALGVASMGFWVWGMEREMGVVLG